MSPEEFIADTADRLGVPRRIREFGVSRILECWINDRRATAATNGSFFEVCVALNWRSFPEHGEVSWAPEGYYQRGALSSEGVEFAATGDPDFDSVYLIWDAVLPFIGSSVRQLLLDAVGLRPQIRSGPLRLTESDANRDRWVHVVARPPLERQYVVGGTPIGTSLFTPERCASSLLRLLELAENLEAEPPLP
ncbi:MAG: hypothetical protein GY725_26675 [bacterium]|nr:hypothetical protein [bacterium]